MKCLYSLVFSLSLIFTFVNTSLAQGDCAQPDITFLEPIGNGSYIVSWEGETDDVDYIIVHVVHVTCDEGNPTDTYVLDVDLQEFELIFQLDPDYFVDEFLVYIEYACSEGAPTTSTTATVDVEECPEIAVPCNDYIPEVHLDCNSGLYCVIIDGTGPGMQEESHSIYGVCEINNSPSGACIPQENISAGATTVTITLCEWRTAGCETGDCCIDVTVSVPNCENDCPVLPFTVDWCCSFDGQYACLCATGPDGTVLLDQITKVYDGYWISDMNIPGICVGNGDLPPGSTPTTVVINNADNSCSYTLTFPDPPCLEGNGGGNFDGGGYNRNQLNKSKSNSLSHYPNPVTDILSIENNFEENIKFEIINTQGEVISNGTSEIGLTQLSIQDFNPGVYYIKYQITNQEIKNSKFIKM